VTLGLTSVAIGGSAASAAPGNIDLTRKGSLTIHKYAANDSEPGAIDGTLPGDPGDPLVATFTLYPVLPSVFNPSVPADWEDWDTAGAALATSAACTAAAAGTNANVGPAVTTVTTTGGSGTASNLDLGAYLVCETVLPEGATAAAAPFVATLPSPFEESWLYDVHAFPKNTVNTLEKEVEAPDGFGIGSTVTFPVSTTIHPLPDGQTYTHFIIKDTLDSRLTPVSIDSVKIGGVDVAYDDSASSGQMLVVSIAPAVVNANIGEEIVVVFKGTVASLGNGTIQNTAVLFVNNPDFSDDTEGVPSNEVITKWGDLKISKVDAGDTSVGLDGAIFEVYASDAPYAADCSTTSPTGDAITVNSATQFTTVSGAITIAGLWITDSDNDPNQAATARCYFVKEVQAPAGFVTPTGDAAYTAVSVTVGATTAAYDVQITNTRQNVPNLPLTGGAGQTALLIGGLALIGGALVLVAARRRKTADHS
jgi:fimbrial isopeptide formation D2 family protein/LPXTG-motif cell wall-anchored protein